MRKITLRPSLLPDDYQGLAALFNTIRTEPITVEQIKHQDHRIPEGTALDRDAEGRLTGHTRQQTVAVDGRGRIVGYADLWRAPYVPPGIVYGAVIVAPAYQRKGVGTRLLGEVEAYAREIGAQAIHTQLRDDLPHSLRFAEQNGYAVTSHECESILDLASFDEAPFQGIVEAARAGGIRFFTLADEPGEATERQLMELEQQTAADDPAHPGGTVSFEEWRPFLLEGEGHQDDFVFLASDGDRLVGTTIMQRRPATDSMYTIFTGVDRAYRGRQLALALKLLSIRAARHAGALYMRTNNDARNLPMLRVNERLGYRPVPGTYHLQKRILA